MLIATEIAAIVLGYLLGSIPFAYILARAVKGVDIRQSGNVGTLSVMRDVSSIAGFVVLALDMGKGLLAVAIANWLGVPTIFVFLSGFAVVVGHSWPVFLGFTGGGGLATALGVLLGVAPREFGISFALIIGAVLLTNNVRFGATVGLVFLPLFIWLFQGGIALVIYSIALPLFLLARNMLRFKRELTAHRGKAEGLIIDREFTPWQTRRKKK